MWRNYYDTTLSLSPLWVSARLSVSQVIYDIPILGKRSKRICRALISGGCYDWNHGWRDVTRGKSLALAPWTCDRYRRLLVLDLHLTDGHVSFSSPGAQGDGTWAPPSQGPRTMRVGSALLYCTRMWGCYPSPWIRVWSWGRACVLNRCTDLKPTEIENHCFLWMLFFSN